MKQTFKFIGNSIVLALCTLYVSAFPASDNPILNRGGHIHLSLPAFCKSPVGLNRSGDTVVIKGDVESESQVALADCPFTMKDLFITPGDNTNWDYNTIVKNTYIYTNVYGYFIKNLDDNLKTLVIIYNPGAKTKLKMVITGTRIDAGNVRYQFLSTTGIMMFDVTVQNDKDGYINSIGKPIDFSSLGPNLIKQTNQATTTGDCSRITGFRECIACSVSDCMSRLWCLITCGIEGLLCMTGWLISCGILNL